MGERMPGMQRSLLSGGGLSFPVETWGWEVTEDNYTRGFWDFCMPGSPSSPVTWDPQLDGALVLASDPGCESHQ